MSNELQTGTEAVRLVQEDAQPYERLQIRALSPAERQAELERETATHKANLEKDARESEHRRRLDTIGFTVLVIVLLLGFVSGILPSSYVGDQKWAQSIASAVLGVLIGRYSVQKKS
ncbi:MAG TPA: hypothetical protein VND93_06765 [Myxococcales bacterium]|nr:hypothetical protein [Myxococcales bacterium]